MSRGVNQREASVIEDLINGLAANQHGVVGRPQLLAAGVTARQVGGLRERRRLRVVHPGVYLVAPSLSEQGRLMAAVLACGPTAMASHIGAGWLREWVPGRSAGSPVDVTLAAGHRRRRPGIRSHRVKDLSPDHRCLVDGIPTTSPLRTIRDLAGVLTPRELERVIGHAERAGAVTADELAGLLQVVHGRLGAPALRAVLGQAAGPAFTRSPGEEVFLAGVRRVRLPAPRVNVLVAGCEVDFYWPDARLVAEIDGWRWHGTRDRFEQDRRRDNRLAAAGITVMRISYRRLVDETDAVLVEVAQALALARSR